MRVGSLVVCVDDTFNEEYHEFLKEIGTIFPKKNKVYTVREVEKVRGVFSIYLEEIVNRIIPFNDGNAEQSWRASLFRELDTPTSISIEEILEETVYA